MIVIQCNSAMIAILYVEPYDSSWNVPGLVWKDGQTLSSQWQGQSSRLVKPCPSFPLKRFQCDTTPKDMVLRSECSNKYAKYTYTQSSQLCYSNKLFISMNFRPMCTWYSTVKPSSIIVLLLIWELHNRNRENAACCRKGKQFGTC